MKSNIRPLRAIALATTFLMTGGLLLPGSAQAVTIDVNSAPIAFANGAGDPKIGELAPVGFSHRYNNVVTVGGVSVDAIVSIISVTGLDSDDEFANGANNILDDLDDDGPPADAIQTRLDVFGPNTGSGAGYDGEVVYRVAFLQSGTQNAATLQNVVINVKDIDGNQFAEFSAISSYILTSNTELQVATNTTNPNLVPAGSTRFFEPLGSSSNNSDEENWVQVRFGQLSFVDIKLGAREAGSAYFALEFSAATFTATIATVNVAAPTYTVSYNNNGSNDPAPSSTTGSGAVTVAAAPSRPGFTFTGWNTELNGTGVGVQAGASLTPSANITLFAQWTAIATTTTAAPTTTIAPTTTVATQRSTVTEESLPATGSNSSPLLLAMMGMTLVGFGWASRASRRVSR